MTTAQQSNTFTKQTTIKLMFLIMVISTILTTIFILPVKSKAAVSIDTLMNRYVGTKWTDEYYGKECKGFANLMWYYMYDVKFIGKYSTDKYYIPNVSGGYEIGRLNFQQMSQQAAASLLKKGQAGDFIQVKRRKSSNGHSMIYVSQDNTGIVVFDCNSDGKKSVRKYHITWSDFYNKNSAMSIYRAYNAHPQPIQPNEPEGQNSVPDLVPSIDSVKITSIDNVIVNFSFSVNNGTLAKIVIKSTLTGETISKSYTSGLSNINYSFNRNNMPTGGNQYYIFLYAYSGSANNYKNEQIHKMRYGNVENCVTFPNTLDNNQSKAIAFNYKFYADLYEDLKNNYGYNESLLYKHWITYGIKEGRIASPAYCSAFYLKNNGDIATAYGCMNCAKAYFHYTIYGYKEGDREISPIFSAKYYLSNNIDVANTYGNNNFFMAAAHFNSCGIYEFRNSSQYYNGQYYKNKNGDLHNMSSYKLIIHYIKYGIGETRIANSSMKIPNI